MTIIIRRPWTRQPPIGTPLSYRSSFVFAGWGSPPHISSIISCSFDPTPQGIAARVNASATNASVTFNLGKAPPVTGSLPWTIVALQYWAGTPGSHGILGLRSGSGPVLATQSGVVQFYTHTGWSSSGISAGSSANLVCVALAHNGDGTGSWFVNGQEAAATGLGTTANAQSSVMLMNWDPGVGNYAPPIGSYSAFAAIINERVPNNVLRQVASQRNPWLLFRPKPIIIPYLPSTAAAPTISDLKATSITSSSVQATYDYTF